MLETTEQVKAHQEAMMTMRNVARTAMWVSVEQAEEALRNLTTDITLLSLIDPTEYARLMQDLPANQEMVRAFVEFRKALQKVDESIRKR